MVRLRRGDDAAAAKVFQEFVARLIRLTRSRLEPWLRHKVDPEDVVQSVCRSFFARYQAGQFTVANWESLWGLLAVITLRKCANQAEHWQAARRDVGREKMPASNGDSTVRGGLPGLASLRRARCTASERFSGFAGEDWMQRECAVRQFEEAWRRGPRPQLDEFLAAGPGRHGLLLELVHVDLEFRHRAGEKATIEEYLQRYPELGENRGDLSGLYEAERDRRRRSSVIRHLSPVAENLGKFRLGEELGAGAFGTVYRAEDTALRRPVALKVLHRGGRPRVCPGTYSLA
jgi:hypothetical protein